LADVNIVDIAPTILHMIGCRIPKNVDGKVLLNMFRKDSEPAKRNVQFEKREKKLKTTRRAREVTRDEEEKILERLRELGYI
jgi:arylsulfatase A-like enzyme